LSATIAETVGSGNHEPAGLGLLPTSWVEHHPRQVSCLSDVILLAAAVERPMTFFHPQGSEFVHVLSFAVLGIIAVVFGKSIRDLFVNERGGRR
jgi:uncharacterized membrane protein YeiH